MTTIDGLSDSEIRFAGRLVARRRVFLGLTVAGVTIGAGLAAFYGWRWAHDPAFPIGPRAVIVLLVLLNARQSLRQYRQAGILHKMMARSEGGAPASS